MLDWSVQFLRFLNPETGEAVQTLKKDNGTYSFWGQGAVRFTPDADYEAKVKRGEAKLNELLDGVDIVYTQPVTSQILGDPNNQTLDGAPVPLYKLPKNDPRRTWVIQKYQPKVLLETVEVTDLTAFGKMGSPITATPNYSQDTGMSAIDLATVSFVDVPTTTNPESTYPATPVREKVVSGEGTWKINADGSVTFTPENGFAGHPTPVYYKAKNTQGKVSKDDGDNTDGRTGVGKITYTYSDASGLVANTFGKQGQTQSSFTKLEGFTDVGSVFNQVDGHGIMFRNVPANWYDDDFFRLLDANGNKVTEVSIDGEGTYTIDVKTGEVTFTPVATFVGTATPARITIADTDYYRSEATDEYGIVQSDAPIANYTPTVNPGDILVRDAYAVGGIGATLTMTPDYSQLKDDHKPVLLDTVSFLNEDGSYPDTPILTKTVDGEGTWTLELVGGAPAEGEEDTREVKFTFTPEKGFIGQPSELLYTASNTNGVESDVPGQVVFVYPTATPQDAITTAKQGEVQNSSDAGEGDQGLTFDKMFPRVNEVPQDWGVNYKLAGAGEDGKLVIPNQGTYEIDGDHVKFTPLPTFTGTATPATVEVHVEGKDGAVATAKYTPVVLGIGQPSYSQVELSAGESKISAITLPADAPEGTKTFSLPEGYVAPNGWEVSIDSETGEVTAKAPNNITGEVGLEVPVTVTYENGIVQETIAPFAFSGDTIAQETQPEYIVQDGKVGQTLTSPADVSQTERADGSLSPVPTTWELVDSQAVTDWKMSIDENGTVTATVPEGTDPLKPVTVDVKVTYPDGSTEIVKADFVGRPEDTRPVDYETTVTVNKDLKPGETKVLTEGKLGEETLQADGTWKVTTQPVNQVIEVGPTEGGSKEVTWTTPVEYDTQVVVDPNMKLGTYDVVQEGVLGETKSTTTVTFNPDGTVTQSEVITETVKQPVPQIIKIGPNPGDGEVKDSVTTPIPFNTVYEFDPNLPAGTVETVTEGVVGERTTIFSQNFVDGKPVGEPTTTTEITKESVNAVVKIGTQQTRPVPYETEIVYDPIVPAGTSVVDTEGKVGSEKLENGEWVQVEAPVKQVIKVGSMVNTDEDEISWTTPVEYPTEVRVNPNMKPGTYNILQEGVMGEDTSTVTITTDANGQISQSEPTTTRTKEPIEQIIEIGPNPGDGVVKDEVKSPVPFNTVYVYDETLKPGQMVVDREGVDGERTTIFTVTFVDGKPVGEPVVTNEITTEPINKIVRVGAEAKPIDFDVEYVADPDMEAGKQVVDQEGKPGTSTLIDGVWTTTEEPTKRIVRVGTKSTTVTSPIPFDVETEYDPNVPAGQTETTQEGVAGEQTVTTTYTVDPETGEITATPGTPEVTKQGVNEIITVGTGDMQPAGEYTREETVPYKTNEPVVNPELQPGEVRIIEGTPGKKVYSYTISEVDGELVKSEETLIESVDPVNTIIEVGPDTELGADYTTTRTVKYEVQVVYDDTLPRGEVVTVQEGENTVYQTKHTVTFDEDGNPIVTSGEETLVTEGRPHIIKVGTKDAPEAVSVVEEDIPFETEVIVDPELAPGQVVEVQAGELGTQETRYVTKVVDGQIVTAAEEPVVTKEPVKRIVKVGQLPFSSEEEIPFEIEIIEDENLPAGQTVVDQEGQVGTKTTTFTLVDGQIVETEEVTKEPFKKIVRVGKKIVPTDGTFKYEYTTEESFEIEVVYDDTMPAGTTEVIQEGQNGIKQVTTTVTIVDSEVVAENTDTTVVQEKQNKIIKVGTKELEKEITKDHAVVIVNYVDEQGLPIASTVVDSVELKGSAYDTTDNKPQTIEFNGKTYELVKVKDGDFETGTMDETLTQVTYVYKVVETPVDPEEPEDPEVKYGSVIVRYEDENGNLIKDSVVDALAKEYGSEYDTTDNKPQTIEFNGQTYELVKVKDGDVEKGEINSPETTVTYIYKLDETPEDPVTPEDPEEPVIEVVTNYVDTDGNVLLEQEKGTHEVKEIPEYVFVETVVDEEGNTTHIYEKVVTPEDPTEPTEPETPEDPTEPTEPETPEDPAEPTEPETPEDPTEPAEPETPEDPTEPTEPETPEDPTEPTEPETPEETEDHTDVPKTGESISSVSLAIGTISTLLAAVFVAIKRRLKNNQ